MVDYGVLGPMTVARDALAVLLSQAGETVDVTDMDKGRPAHVHQAAHPVNGNVERSHRIDE